MISELKALIGNIDSAEENLEGKFGLAKEQLLKELSLRKSIVRIQKNKILKHLLRKTEQDKKEGHGVILKDDENLYDDRRLNGQPTAPAKTNSSEPKAAIVNTLLPSQAFFQGSTLPKLTPGMFASTKTTGNGQGVDLSQMDVQGDSANGNLQGILGGGVKGGDEASQLMDSVESQQQSIDAIMKAMQQLADFKSEVQSVIGDIASQLKTISGKEQFF